MSLKNSSHNDTVVKFASSMDEVNNAFDLVKDIFIREPNSQSSTSKDLSWNVKSNTIIKNIIIATSGSDVIGVVRLCPRTFLWQREKFKVAGISSVCVHPEFRKMGVARLLLETTINHCDQRGYELTFLVARRAVDHFYKKFGFFGKYKIEFFWIFRKIRRYGFLRGDKNIGVKIHPHLWGQINFSSIFGKILKNL